MKASRRQAIKTGMAAGAALVTDLGWPITTARASDAASSHLGRSSFDARVGDLFRLKHGSTVVDLRLARVTDVPCAHRAALVGHAGCFVAVFEGPIASLVAQGTYRVENRAMGAFDLFVVPGGPGHDGATCVATFNRPDHTT